MLSAITSLSQRYQYLPSNTPHCSIPTEDKHTKTYKNNTHDYNRLLCAGAALLIREYRTVFPVLICRRWRRTEMCCVWQSTVVPSHPPFVPESRGSRCFVVVVSSWRYVRPDEDLHRVLPVPPYSFHRGFVSSFRLGPRQRATGPSVLTLRHVAGDLASLCVCGQDGGQRLRSSWGSEQQPGRRRPAAVWLLTSCGADGGAPVLLNILGFHCHWNFKNMWKKCEATQERLFCVIRVSVVYTCGLCSCGHIAVCVFIGRALLSSMHHYDGSCSKPDKDGDLMLYVRVEVDCSRTVDPFICTDMHTLLLFSSFFFLCTHDWWWLTKWLLHERMQSLWCCLEKGRRNWTRSIKLSYFLKWFKYVYK